MIKNYDLDYLVVLKLVDACVLRKKVLQKELVKRQRRLKKCELDIKNGVEERVRNDLYFLELRQDLVAYFVKEIEHINQALKVFDPSGELEISSNEMLTLLQEEEEQKEMQGYCPKCGSDDLEYGTSKLDGNQMCYEFECKNCGAVCEEWYVLEFAETIVKY